MFWITYPGPHVEKPRGSSQTVNLSPAELSIPVLVPFQNYAQPMLDCEGMKVSALVVDKLNPDKLYLAEDDVVLLDPPITVTVSRKSTNQCLQGVVLV